MNRFLRPWKRKVAYWHLERALRREPSRSGPSAILDRHPSDVLILVDGSDSLLLELARKLESQFSGSGSVVRVHAFFGDHDDHPEMIGHFFNEASLSWRGMPEDDDTRAATLNRSGMLLCLSGGDCLPIQLLAARCSADVKVAIDAAWPFYDIILEGHTPPYADLSDHLFSVLQTMKRTAHEHA